MHSLSVPRVICVWYLDLFAYTQLNGAFTSDDYFSTMKSGRRDQTYRLLVIDWSRSRNPCRHFLVSLLFGRRQLLKMIGSAAPVRFSWFRAGILRQSFPINTRLSVARWLSLVARSIMGASSWCVVPSWLFVIIFGGL